MMPLYIFLMLISTYLTNKLLNYMVWEPMMWTCYWVWAALVLSIIMCSFCYTLNSVLLLGCFCPWLLILNFVFSLLFWFCNYALLWMILPLNILYEYWIEPVFVELIYATFRFYTRMFYRGVPWFATDCPCGVWCRGLTTCLRYVGPTFGNLIWNDNGCVRYDIMESNFVIIFNYVYICMYIYIWVCLHVSQCLSIRWYKIFTY